MKRIALTALFILTLALEARAQQTVQRAGQQSDVATMVSTVVSSAGTFTITPPSGNYIYFTNVEMQNCAGATTVTGAAPTSITTTNMGGLTWLIGSGSTAAGQCLPTAASGSFGKRLKSTTPGTAVVFTLPTFATNQTVRLSVYYYFAP